MLGFLGDVRYGWSPALSLKDEGAVRRATGAFPFRSGNAWSGGGQGSSRQNSVALQRMLRLLLVTRDERAPGLRAKRLGGLPDHFELAVVLDLADHHRLVQVVVALVHDQRVAGWRLEALPGHRLANLVDLGAPGLFTACAHMWMPT